MFTATKLTLAPMLPGSGSPLAASVFSLLRETPGGSLLIQPVAAATCLCASLFYIWLPRVSNGQWAESTGRIVTHRGPKKTVLTQNGKFQNGTEQSGWIRTLVPPSLPTYHGHLKTLFCKRVSSPLTVVDGRLAAWSDFYEPNAHITPTLRREALWWNSRTCFPVLRHPAAVSHGVDGHQGHGVHRVRLEVPQHRAGGGPSDLVLSETDQRTTRKPVCFGRTVKN